MSAAATQSSRSNDLSQTISHLSQTTKIPVREIEAIYSDEVNRLAAEARIKTFVGVLAIARTRTILHEHKQRSAHG